MIEFTHLHLHTEYSLLDGFCRIDKVLDRCEQYNMKSVAITDHGVMFGVIEFYKKAKARGIKPIIGCEIYVTPGDYKSKTTDDKKRYHLILLAENWNGYQNLIKLVSEAHINGFYYKPRVDKNLLRKHSDGLICLSACLSGEVQDFLRVDDYDSAKNAALEYRDIFGKDNFFLELQDHGLMEQKKVNIFLKKLSKELSIPLVATNDAHYTDQDDAKTHDVLLCIGTGATVNQDKRMRFPNNQFYFKSQEEMNELFKDSPEALANTQVIAERCNVDFVFHEMHLPHFEINQNHAEYLKEMTLKGINTKYETVSSEILERTKFELDMIERMGFTDYFLIVSDFIDYAKKNGIPVGPGRGSAAGSIVSYALGITGIDPIKYDLLFERFLNPERVSMPDIDIDFCYERRDEVIEYVKSKYGEDKVAQIVTFGTMAARNAIRDVGRALDIDYATVDKIAKQIPQELNMTIEKALKVSKDFYQSYIDSSEKRELIDMAMAVEGMPRHTSTHAAGVVIASKSIDEFVPLIKNGEQISTQYNMIELEELGLLKMDFLGLRTLTVISDAVKLIYYNKGLKVNIYDIDVNDKKVMNLFTNAETIGIFQFESEGMRAFLRDLKPTRFDDLIAANSLFRPGPMNEIPNYIKNSHNQANIQYLHPKLKPILETTYGTIVFQEQVMQIVQQLAGFSLGEADNLRRAMGKKKMDVMEENREYFVHGKIENGEIILPGAIRNGVDEITANKIYDLMIDFAKYAFNKSHSAAYSYIAMQTAWLKTYYPEEFMASLLSSVMGNTAKVYLYIKEAKNLGIEILPPSVNSSFNKFSVENGKIRMGLSTIKTVGKNLVDSIIMERKKSPFISFEDFIERMVKSKTSNINKAAIEALILSGAMDSFGLKRSQMYQVYIPMIESFSTSGINVLTGQEDIFSILNDENTSFEIPNMDEFPKRELLKKEKEYLGVYITDHPYNSYNELVKDRINFTTLDLLNGDIKYNKSVYFGGIITSVKQILTKRNDDMAFLELEDNYGSIEAVVFPSIFTKYRELIKEDNAIFINGTLQINDRDSANIIINGIKEINRENFSQNVHNNVIIDKDKSLFLRLQTFDEKLYKQIRELLVKNKGKSEVIIYFADTEKSSRLKNIYVDLENKQLVNNLYSLLGSDNVVIE
ncbi:DNA polymerase III subunit alpha [Helcococcus kunzii]|uniref:DNA polymerase III subunit alpha n=1 Tax=Helcococcus kunzii TaxID=40091 RepID=UPI0021A89324|nr:DNA polymerase III subunit alpha [Helcococcus kunzii]MCT1796163.1 DNA polymerase III subunit alpha [Helcococcus kunzii]MCT1989224.1 DNA polymerase III subunit alpha [Helcococcus kunzii]